MQKYKKALVWLRRDLRLYDHAALSAAAREAESIALTFVLDKNILTSLPENDRRLSFIFDSLLEINQELKDRGSCLILCYGDPTFEIPKLAGALKVDAVYTNEDYESYAKRRDQKVDINLRALGVEMHLFKDQVIFSGAEILTGSNTPYKVFTPYFNNWKRQLKTEDYQEKKVRLAHLMPAKNLNNFSSKFELETYGFHQQQLWLAPGTAAGKRRLKSFSQKLSQYDRMRDFPAANATSGLSVHLRFGTVSIRDCVRTALNNSSKGAQTWLKELVWREFYQMILDQFPHVETGCFKPQYDAIKWPGKEQHFQAWCEGKTGFPIIDAAMIHFNQTGWMHNRLRMIVASFLVKDLLIDWKRGEKYFAQNLLDFDLAANNGGWQWCASTGCDAQPYFRIFNPIAQSKKCDPDNEFIDQYVKNKTPEIVNHSQQRLKALKLYQDTH